MDTYQQALDLMAATPSALEAVVAAVPAEVLDRRPGPEAWSIREILAHMLHVETRVIGQRIRLMLCEEEPVLEPAPAGPAAGDARDLLAAWLKARSASLAMLRAITPEQLARVGRHPRYGRIAVREHVVEWAYHDLDHLRQILAALQAGLYPDIGGFQALYPQPV